MIQSRIGAEEGDEIMFDHGNVAEVASFDFDDCEFCGGTLAMLGVLGNTEWTRCCNCGIELATEFSSVEWNDA